MSVGILVPACNEEKTIKMAVQSLSMQSYIPDIIIIIPNNCTDKTEEVAFELKEVYDNIEVFPMENNRAKKAGALNFGLKKIIDEVEYVVSMDADTVLDRRLIKKGIEALDKNPHLGAVCSRAGVLEAKNISFFEKIMWHLQHLEYGGFDSQRVETLNQIKVVHGMVAMFRTKALKDILRHYRKEKEEVYKENNLVEDYELTLCLKEIGWDVSISLEMLAWTTVPLSWKEWWIQRLRWLRGGVDSLREHGWNSVTKGEIFQHLLFVFVMVLQIIILSLCVIAIQRGHPLKLNPWFMAVLSIGYFNMLYRLKYVQKISSFDVILRVLLIPEIIYSWIQMAAMTRSYYLSFTKVKQEWYKRAN